MQGLKRSFFVKLGYMKNFTILALICTERKESNIGRGKILCMGKRVLQGPVPQLPISFVIKWIASLRAWQIKWGLPTPGMQMT